MRTLGNIIWHIPFLGFINAILVYIFGVILTATIIASPIGLGLMEYGKFLFAPFSYSMVSKAELNIEQNTAWKTYSLIIRILYFPFGLVMAFFAIFQVAFLFITIIGIPIALVVAKSLGTYFNPVNKKCVPIAVTQELDRRKGQEQVKKHLAYKPGNIMDKENAINSIFCSNCGKKYSNDSIGQFCDECGNQL